MIKLELLDNSGTAFENDPEDRFEWENVYKNLIKFLEERKENGILDEIKKSRKPGEILWPGSKTVIIELSEKAAIKLFDIIEQLPNIENDTGQKELFDIRKQLIVQLDIKKLHFK